MKKLSLITGVVLSALMGLTVVGCGNKNNSSSSSDDVDKDALAAVEVDPYSLTSNYRDLRIKGRGYAGEQFTEHSRLVDDNGVTKEEKTYVVENVRALVVPVDFTDYPYSLYNDTEDGAREELRKVMFGTPEEMEWYSLAEYYKQSSFGKCNISANPNRGFVNAIIAFLNPGISAKGAIAPDISSIPYINIANPIRIVPTFLRLFVFDAIIKITPISANTGANVSGFNNLKKSPALSCIAVKLNIQAVIVVPKFAPIITVTVLDNVIIPEFTSPINITVTADED